MKRVAILAAMLALGTAFFTLTAVADPTVTHGWVGCCCDTYQIHITGAEQVENPKFDTSLFDIINPSKWDIGKDDVSLHHIYFFAGPEMFTLAEVGIQVVTFTPYQELKLRIPAEWDGRTLVAPGDDILVFLAWMDFDPIDTFTVGECTPSEPDGVARKPKALIVPVHVEILDPAEGIVEVTWMNRGDAPFVSADYIVGLGVHETATGDYWPPEHGYRSTEFFEEGPFAIGPGESASCVFDLPEITAFDGVGLMEYVRSQYTDATFAELPVLSVGFLGQAASYAYLDPQWLAMLER